MQHSLKIDDYPTPYSLNTLKISLFIALSLSVAHHLISLNSSTAHTGPGESAQAPRLALRGRPASPSICLANNRNPLKKLT